MRGADRAPGMPFGGYKESGIGRECGDAALDNYTETKTVYWNMGMKAPPTGPREAGTA
jgi:aldehyde dehydrogenase (NAD+)